MSDTIDIVIEADAWDEADLKTWAQNALDMIKPEHAISSDLEISILACDDARIAELNTEFRGKATPTNVLSWPSSQIELSDSGTPDFQIPDDGQLGDIAIAYETCAREALEQGKEFAAHVTHLLLHAILHLFGYDHETDAQAHVMESLETRLLAKMGIDDPYYLSDA
ncbi:MAG: rRNA maturation RNase YbeY [Pseudomonadota bacterium]